MNTQIMGVVNVTPDSFSDGGKYLEQEKAISHAKELVAVGADILDIGGESSRPGAKPVPIEEELRRVLPVIQEITTLNVPISIDTVKPEVADACLAAGATILNDITGFVNEAMLTVAKKHNATIIIMHMQGKPQTMQQNPTYENVVKEVRTFFEKQIEKAKGKGVTNIILDPGIGFGKTLEHNVSLLQHIQEFADLGYPVLIGVSRKSFIEKIVPGTPVDKRLPGTIAANTFAIINGANILRVHDVEECKQATQVADALTNK